MKTPTLGQIVLYVPLSSDAAQSFVPAAEDAIGETVIRSIAYPSGFRAATVVGIPAGPEDGDDAKTHGRATLLVYKQPGDPFRGDGDVYAQRIGDVPYSASGVAGSWMYEKEARALGAGKEIGDRR